MFQWKLVTNIKYVYVFIQVFFIKLNFQCYEASVYVPTYTVINSYIFL